MAHTFGTPFLAIKDIANNELRLALALAPPLPGPSPSPSPSPSPNPDPNPGPEPEPNPEPNPIPNPNCSPEPLQLEPEHTLAEECSGEPAGKKFGFTSPVALSPWAGLVVRPA